MKHMIAYAVLLSGVVAVLVEARAPRASAQQVSTADVTGTPYADASASTGGVAASTYPAAAPMVVDDREPGPPTENSPRQVNTPPDEAAPSRAGESSSADKRRSREIRDALHKEVPGVRGLKTEFRDGRLTLRGIASSEQEKEDAGSRAAELVGAGSSVDNQIIVK